MTDTSEPLEWPPRMILGKPKQQNTWRCRCGRSSGGAPRLRARPISGSVRGRSATPPRTWKPGGRTPNAGDLHLPHLRADQRRDVLPADVPAPLRGVQGRSEGGARCPGCRRREAARDPQEAIANRQPRALHAAPGMDPLPALHDRQADLRDHRPCPSRPRRHRRRDRTQAG